MLNKSSMQNDEVTQAKKTYLKAYHIQVNMIFFKIVHLMKKCADLSKLCHCEE